ncbi:ribonuclease H-like [Choloepus didactylus]|uniref:ribonuclease H-like n=1 Tax=Choloepus didactylus TaxID=27675 RepID=UPI00189D6106|nr:ribonuclease H-like [Choloepus didactylus]
MKDSPLPLPANTWLIDGSAFKDPSKQAGYAIVSAQKIIESGPLPPGTTFPQTELIALIQSLKLVVGIPTNIYTDSKYAFHIIHSHLAIWKERGYLTSKNSLIINKTLIFKLLEAAQIPTQVAVIHYKGHQSGKDPISMHNKKADKEEKRQAQTPTQLLGMPTPVPAYSTLEQTDLAQLGATLNE